MTAFLSGIQHNNDLSQKFTMQSDHLWCKYWLGRRDSNPHLLLGIRTIERQQNLNYLGAKNKSGWLTRFYKKYEVLIVMRRYKKEKAIIDMERY